MLCHVQSDVCFRVLLIIEKTEESQEIRFDTGMGSCGCETIENVGNKRFCPIAGKR